MRSLQSLPSLPARHSCLGLSRAVHAAGGAMSLLQGDGDHMRGRGLLGYNAEPGRLS